MGRFLALALFAYCLAQSGIAGAQDAAKQLVGTWKLTAFYNKFDGGDPEEPFGPNPKGRLVVTSDGFWLVIISGENRKPASNNDERAALLNSLVSYTGKYTIDGDKITTNVDISWNEFYTGPNRQQVRFFRLDGDKLTIRSPVRCCSANRPGQTIEGFLTWERER